MISHSVYVVDDEPDLRQGITAALEVRHYEFKFISRKLDFRSQF
jgi:DNA-binding response OmpR family regulator